MENISLKQFSEELKNRLFENNQGLRKSFSITDDTIIKNNNVRIPCLKVNDNNSRVQKIIYIDKAYESFINGISMSNILHKLENVITSNNPNIDVSFYRNFDDTMNKIIPKLINREANREFLKSVPHMNYGDLAVIFTAKVTEDGYITVKNEHADNWGVKDTVLMEVAVHNVKSNYKLTTFDEIFPGIGLNDFYILTNKQSVYGASSILNPVVMDLVSHELGGDLIIIPSSVHETIVLPINGNIELGKELNMMIREVNATELSQEEILSDHAYKYNSKTHELYIDGEDKPMELVSGSTGKIFSLNNDTTLSFENIEKLAKGTFIKDSLLGKLHDNAVKVNAKTINVSVSEIAHEHHDKDNILL